VVCTRLPQVNSLGWNRSGHRLATGSGDQSIRIWLCDDKGNVSPTSSSNTELKPTKTVVEQVSHPVT
jgi:WD40 repeat protein